jgi:hypothetical protein
MSSVETRRERDCDCEQGLPDVIGTEDVQTRRIKKVDIRLACLLYVELGGYMWARVQDEVRQWRMLW